MKEAASGGRLATLLLKGFWPQITDSGDSLWCGCLSQMPIWKPQFSVDEPKLDESLSCLYQAAAKIYSCILTVKAPTPRTGALSFEMQTFLFCFSYLLYIYIHNIYSIYLLFFWMHHHVVTWRTDDQSCQNGSPKPEDSTDSPSKSDTSDARLTRPSGWHLPFSTANSSPHGDSRCRRIRRSPWPTSSPSPRPGRRFHRTAR